MPSTSFFKKLAVLPPSSYHVTLFIGLNEYDRKNRTWAKNLARDISLELINEQFILKLRARPQKPLSACRFIVDLDAKLPSNNENLFIPLKPADSSTYDKLQSVRDELSELLQIKRKDHNSYQYHISLGYLFKSLNDTELEEYQQKNISWRKHVSKIGEIIIPSFHFCTLNDMHAFKIICQV